MQKFSCSNQDQESYFRRLKFTYGKLDDDTIWIRTPNRKFLRVTPITLQVLIELNQGIPPSLLSQKYNLPEEDLFYILNTLKRAGGISPPGEGEITPAEQVKDINLLPYLVLIMSLALIQLYYFHSLPHPFWLKNWLDGGIVILFTIIAAFIHELGHFFFAKPYFHPKLKFTFFLIFPILYRDTQEAWALPRNIRLLINLGGVMFDLLVNTVAILIAFFYRPLEYYITPFLLVQYTRLLFVLNPLIPTDGYWLLSDLTRKVNLRKASFWNLRQLRINLYFFYAVLSLLFLAFILRKLTWFFFNIFKKIF
jgi:hypothetical protein